MFSWLALFQFFTFPEKPDHKELTFNAQCKYGTYECPRFPK